MFKNLKSRVVGGDVLIGCWLNLGCALTSEIIAAAGFDWVLVDLEHGVGTEKDTLYQIEAVARTDAEVFVRVESQARERAHRVLDLGAAGVMFPRVNTPSEAEAAVSAIRYPPAGVRGIAQMTRAAAFGSEFTSYLATANDGVLGIVQVESVESVANVERIAAVDGVDVLFVGPADLTASMGIFGQFDHPEFGRAIDDVVAAAAKYHKCAGIMCTPVDFARYLGLGYRFIACGSDAGILNTAARSQAAQLGNERAKFLAG